MTVTKLDADAVQAAATALGRIMDDQSAFDRLRETWPQLGNFDLARQLQAIIDNRRAGVLAQVDGLKSGLDEMEHALVRISGRVQAVDDTAALEILNIIAGLRADLLGTAQYPVEV